MDQIYIVKEPVRGVFGLSFGIAREFDYPAGEVTPADGAEAEVLEHLVASGLADRAAPAPRKRTQKEA